MAAIDIEKPGKYPIVLSDALLGKASKETYTGIRYNHKPGPSDSSSASSKLKPSKSGSSYDLSLQDNSDKYSYHGVRTSGDGQYVLIFDPAKKHFVLHRVDSTLDMNLVNSPWENDTSILQSQYPQLPSQAASTSDTPERKPTKATKAAPSAKSTKAAPPTKAPKAAPPPKAEPKRRKPVQPKKKAPVREPTPEEDSDDGLTIEYPDSAPPQQYHSTPSFQRHDSEEASDEDADGEEYEEEKNQDVDYLKLPSPGNNNAGGMSDEDIELDLEAELEQALKEEGGADESSESEEE